nr:hypothetical protein KK1_016023 [Ipomoea trifida]
MISYSTCRNIFPTWLGLGRILPSGTECQSVDVVAAISYESIASKRDPIVILTIYSSSMSYVLSLMNSRRSMKPSPSPSTPWIISFSSSSAATWPRLPMMDPSSDHKILPSPLTSNLLNTCSSSSSTSLQIRYSGFTMEFAISA